MNNAPRICKLILNRKGNEQSIAFSDKMFDRLEKSVGNLSEARDFIVNTTVAPLSVVDAITTSFSGTDEFLQFLCDDGLEIKDGDEIYIFNTQSKRAIPMYFSGNKEISKLAINCFNKVTNDIDYQSRENICDRLCAMVHPDVDAYVDIHFETALECVNLNSSIAADDLIRAAKEPVNSHFYKDIFIKNRLSYSGMRGYIIALQKYADYKNGDRITRDYVVIKSNKNYQRTQEENQQLPLFELESDDLRVKRI